MVGGTGRKRSGGGVGVSVGLFFAVGFFLMVDSKRICFYQKIKYTALLLTFKLVQMRIDNLSVSFKFVQILTDNLFCLWELKLHFLN